MTIGFLFWLLMILWFVLEQEIRNTDCRDWRSLALSALFTCLSGLFIFYGITTQNSAFFGLAFLGGWGAFGYFTVWIIKASRKSDSTLLRFLEKFRTYLADEPVEEKNALTRSPAP